MVKFSTRRPTEPSFVMSKPSSVPHRALPLAACLVGLLAAPGTAHAYLDPASGSILLQVVLGGIAGAGLLVKLYWHRMLQVFGLRRPEADDRREP
jgi:hypothetical protein